MCKEVSNEIRRRQNRKNEYYIGEVVICKKHSKTITYQHHVNFRNRVTEINSRVVTSKEEHAGNIQTLPVDVLKKTFFGC